MKKIYVLLISILSFGLLVSCDNKKDNGKLNVVASTTMLGDLVRQIGKEKVDVIQLFSPGIDPHLALPSGADTKALAESDLIVFSGLHLEAQFIEPLSSYKDKTLFAGDLLDESKILKVKEDDGEAIDPHIWFSVPIWMDITRIVGNRLKEADSKNEEFYEENIINYLKELEDLHNWINQELDENLPLEKRILVTAHDAFIYFSHEYKFEVAAIQGISTESEAAPSDIMKIANLILEKNVKAIFIESTVPKKTVDAVINEVKSKNKDYVIKIGKELYSDALGINDNQYYLNAIKTNVNNIIEGLK